MLRLLRLYVSAKMDYEGVMGVEHDAREDINFNDRTRLQYRAAMSAQRLAKSIQDTAMSLLEGDDPLHADSKVRT